MCGIVAWRGTHGLFRVVVCFSFGDILGFREVVSAPNGARIEAIVNEKHQNEGNQIIYEVAISVKKTFFTRPQK